MFTINMEQSEQSKLQWLWKLVQMNGGNLSNGSRESSRASRNKKREYPSSQIEAWEMVK
jgi:hypothetical protein